MANDNEATWTPDPGTDDPDGPLVVEDEMVSSEPDGGEDDPDTGDGDAGNDVEVDEGGVEDTEEVEGTPEKPKGMPQEENWDNKVKFTPEQQQRFNRVYGENKHLKEAQKVNADNNKALLKKVQELEAKLNEGTKVSKVATLEAKRAQAIEENDITAALQITEELTLAKLQEGDEGEKLELRDLPEETEIDKDEPDNSNIPQPYVDAFTDWAMEENEAGEFKRPYAHPGHPMHQQALQAATGIIEEVGPDKSPQVYLDAVERKMSAYQKRLGVKGTRKNPSVAESKDTPSGGGDKGQSTGGKLSPAEAMVARQMFADEPDPLKAYREAKTQINETYI